MSNVPTIISAAQTVTGAGRLAHTRKGTIFRMVILIHIVPTPSSVLRAASVPCLIANNNIDNESVLLKQRFVWI